MIKATVFNDAACPWGYSANPAFRVLEWRYGDQIEWRLVVIGLRDEVTDAMREQFDPAGVTRLTVFRDRYRMPFALEPKARAASTGRGCRAVVAARLVFPGSEFRVLRALQLANFTSDLLLDDDDQIRARAGRPARDRCRGDRRAARRPGGRRGIRARQGRGTRRGRNGRRSAGQGSDHRARRRSLHRSLGHLRTRRAATRRRRLATRARLRPLHREPRSHPDPNPAAGDGGSSARALSRTGSQQPRSQPCSPPGPTM